MKKKLLIIWIALVLATTGVIYGFTYRTTTSKTPAKKVTKTQCTKFKTCSKALQVNYGVKNCSAKRSTKTSIAKATPASAKN